MSVRINKNTLKGKIGGIGLDLIPVSETKFRVTHWMDKIGLTKIIKPPIDFNKIGIEFYRCTSPDSGYMIINLDNISYEICCKYPKNVNFPYNWNIIAGEYQNVQIRDAGQPSCLLVLNNSVSVTQPSVLNATVTPSMITCNGANDGIINITGPSGGYGTYEYTITGGTTWSVTGLFTGLAPSSYDVRIRDAANPLCVIVLNNALNITEPAALNASLASTNITCFGANNGTITISSASGGYGTYDYTITGGAGWQASGSFTNLTPGTYNVQIRDKAGAVPGSTRGLTIGRPAVMSQGKTAADFARTKLILR